MTVDRVRIPLMNMSPA